MGAESEMVKRMLSADPDVTLPPPNSHREVTPQQVETLKRWIDQGAAWENIGLDIDEVGPLPGGIRGLKKPILEICVERR